MNFDDLLRDHVGEFGLYQRLLLVIIVLVGFNNNWEALDIVFTAGVPEYRCADNITTYCPEVANLSGSIGYWQLNDTDPAGKCSRRTCGQMPENASVPWFNATSNDVDLEPCSSWQYDTSTFTYTVVMQWNLVCDREWLMATAQSMYILGMLPGSFLGGLLADRFGRRPTFIAAALTSTTVRIASAFSPNYNFFIACRFFIGALTIVMYSSLLVIGTEMVGRSWRVFVANMQCGGWALGYMSVAGFAYLFRNWSILTIILTTPSFILLPFLWFLPESPRWLLARGRKDEAEKIIHKVAKWNGTSVPEKLDIDIQEKGKQGSLLDIIKSRRLTLRTLMIFYIWITVSMVYYGLVLNVGTLAGNIYLNTFISGAAEVPGYIGATVLLNTRLGRRFTLALVMFLCGGLLLAMIPIPDDNAIIATALAMFGKANISLAFSAIYIYTAELYPTNFRTAALGASSTVARIFSIISPFIGQLGRVSPALPPVIFGGLSVGCGAICLLLPETRNRALPQSIHDAEKFTRSSRGSKDLSPNIGETDSFISDANKNNEKKVVSQ